MYVECHTPLYTRVHRVSERWCVRWSSSLDDRGGASELQPLRRYEVEGPEGVEKQLKQVDITSTRKGFVRGRAWTQFPQGMVGELSLLEMCLQSSESNHFNFDMLLPQYSRPSTIF